MKLDHDPFAVATGLIDQAVAVPVERSYLRPTPKFFLRLPGRIAPGTARALDIVICAGSCHRHIEIEELVWFRRLTW